MSIKNKISSNKKQFKSISCIKYFHSHSHSHSHSRSHSRSRSRSHSLSINSKITKNYQKMFFDFSTFSHTIQKLIYTKFWIWKRENNLQWSRIPKKWTESKDNYLTLYNFIVFKFTNDLFLCMCNSSRLWSGIFWWSHIRLIFYGRVNVIFMSMENAYKIFRCNIRAPTK
jgi:hypothetical protein